MYTKQEIIIRYYREGKSQRQIARDLHLSRKTIKRYIEGYEETVRTNKDFREAQSIYLTTPPAYKNYPRSKLKLTREVEGIIDELLSLNAQKKSQGLRKQMLKKKDILEELHRQGQSVGYTTVCNYIRMKESSHSRKESYIRQIYSPGDICEFDWGEIKLHIGDCQMRLHLAVFTSAYSNYRYGFIYNRQDTLSFMDSHVRFFDEVGGVFHQMVYDNMRVAVAQFIGPHEKEPTVSLLQLRGHYGFSHRFCNAYRGNEKGHVERSVEYVRRKAFGLKDRFTDIEEAETWLFKVLNKINGEKQTGTGKTALEMFTEEKSVLGILPPSRLVCSEQIQLRVDKYATVSYRTNRYSVPDDMVGKFVEVSVASDRLEIYYQSGRIAGHNRSFAKHDWVIDITHYLSTFKKKPGALPDSVALASNVYLKNLYFQHFRNEPRNFIDLLVYCRHSKISEEKLEESVQRILLFGNGILTTEKLMALLGNEESPGNFYGDVENTICEMAKQQLSELTILMHQMN
jgi:transposase